MTLNLFTVGVTEHLGTSKGRLRAESPAQLSLFPAKLFVANDDLVVQLFNSLSQADIHRMNLEVFEQQISFGYQCLALLAPIFIWHRYFFASPTASSLRLTFLLAPRLTTFASS